MFKRDRIFFAACGIFAVGVVLEIMNMDLGLLFLVGAYLLRPTLHAFDLATKFADERQVEVHSRSGNIAFIAVMLAMLGFALGHLAQRRTAGRIVCHTCHRYRRPGSYGAVVVG